MPQTYYRRPFYVWPLVALSTTLSAVSLILLYALGIHHVATLMSWIATIVVGLVGIILDPETTYVRRKRMDDGALVKVVRPFVGFRRYEVLVGVTGGYEVAVDGFRREPALIRL